MSAANSDVTKKMIELRSSDGELFQVEEKVAVISGLLKSLTEAGCGTSVIPVTNVTGKILAKVIEYCTKHAEAAEKNANEEDSAVKANVKKDLDAFEAEFVKVEREELFGLLMAANFMEIKGLLSLTCQAIADRIKDMTVEQIRDFLEITNDFTPEEEENIRNEHPWAFDE